MRWLALILAVPLTSCQEKDPWAGNPNVPEEISFNQHIRPLFTRECLSCHGEEKAAGDLRLDRPSGVASVTTDNSPQKSLLWEKVAADHPAALPDREKAILWRWIKQGTPTEGHWSSLPLQKALADPPSLSVTEPVSEQEFAFLARALFGREPTAAELTYHRDHQPPRGDLIDSMLRQPTFAASFKTRLLLLSGTSPVASSTPFAPYLRWLDAEVAGVDFALDDFFREALAGDLLPAAGQQGTIATAWVRLPHRRGFGSLAERVTKSLLAIEPGREPTPNDLWPGAAATLSSFLPEFPPATSGEIARPPFLPVHTPQQLEALKKAEEAEVQAWQLTKEIPSGTAVAFAQWLAEEEPAVDLPNLAVAFSFDAAIPKDLAPRPVASLRSPVSLAEGVQGTALAPPAEFEGLPLASDRAFTFSFFLKLSHLPEKEEPLFFSRSPGGAPLGFRLNLSPTSLTVALLNGSAANSLAAQTSTLPAPGQWHHLAIGYDGSRRAEGFQLWIDAQPIPLAPRRGQVYGLARSPGGSLSYRYPNKENLPPTLIDELQIHRRLLSEIEVAHLRDGRALLAAVRDEFPREDLLFNYYVSSKSLPARQVLQRAIGASNEVATLQATGLLVPVAGPTPLPQLRPPLPFFALPLDSNPDRLGLANWLFDDRNPITPRVLASRLYRMIHGVSLLPAGDISDPWKVPADPVLLDYIARQILVQEWNVRTILRTILLHPPAAEEIHLSSSQGAPSFILSKRR